METINIPKNTYNAPTAIRPEIVQGICEAFLCGGGNSVFHPCDGGPYRDSQKYIIRHKYRAGVKYVNPDYKFYGFASLRQKMNVSDFTEYVEFNGAEMREAFRVLRNNGWHMFRVYSHGAWMGYKLSCKPYMNGGVEVAEFTENID